MEPPEIASTSDHTEPRKLPAGRSILERWADENDVERSALTRIFAAVDERVPGAPLVIPSLDDRSYYDPGLFPWIEQLIGAADELRTELATLSDALTPHPESAALVEAGGWQACFVWRSSRRNTRIAATAPIAAKVSEFCPGGGRAGNSYYSVIDAGTRLRRHSGPFNARLRCHLGLDVPETGCQIEIAGEYRSWHTNECLVFSDFPPHSVINASDRTRAVYVLDFWHPGLTTVEQNVLAALLVSPL